MEKEISKLVALSEERITQLQLLHLFVDNEADAAVQVLSQEILKVHGKRKECHTELDLMFGEQLREIREFVISLEERNVSSNGNIESDNNDSTFRFSIDQQLDIIATSNTENCSYSLPVIAVSSISNCSRQLNSIGDTVTNNGACDVEICAQGVDSYLTAFVSDYSSGSVSVFNIITEELQRTIGSKLGAVYGLSLLHSAALEPLLFVSCYDQHKILVFNAISGEMIKTIGAYGTGEGQLNGPKGVCVASQNFTSSLLPPHLLYVCDGGNHRVQVFDIETGSSVMTIGSGHGHSTRHVHFPQYLSVFAGNKAVKDSKLYVSDTNHVAMFDANTGAFIASVGKGSLLNCPAGVAVCALDNVSDPLLIVSDYNNCRIHVFNGATGVPVKSVGGGNAWSHVDHIDYPCGLRAFAVAKDNIAVFVIASGKLRKINISVGTS